MTDITLIEGYIDSTQSCVEHPDAPLFKPKWVPAVVVKNLELNQQRVKEGDLFD